MASNSQWGMTPQQSIEGECARRGRADVIAGCRALVRGEQVDPDLLLVLGGPAARKFLDGGVHDDTYWLRVWGARGLLWVWDDAATPEVRLALRDDAWRVREMGLKVIARQRMGDLATEVAKARDDPVPRVRQAADRALTLLTASGA
ncbi:MAG: hypothetical protein WAN48_03115 [Actinomycetes bacterium]